MTTNHQNGVPHVNTGELVTPIDIYKSTYTSAQYSQLYEIKDQKHLDEEFARELYPLLFTDQPDEKIAREPNWGSSTSQEISDAEFKLSPQTYKDLSRDLIYKSLNLNDGDSIRQQLITRAWEKSQLIRKNAPEYKDKLVEKWSDLPTNARKAVVVAVVSAVALTSSGLFGEKEDAYLNMYEDSTAHEYDTVMPKNITISYEVPTVNGQTPRVLDLANALDVSPDTITSQLDKLGHSILDQPESRLPAGKQLNLDIQGTSYQPNNQDTFEQICERFGVTANVLLAANPNLKGIGASGLVQSIADEIMIPKPVIIVNSEQPINPEILSSIPEVQKAIRNDAAEIANIASDGTSFVVGTGVVGAPQQTNTTSTYVANTTQTTETRIDNEQITPAVQRVNRALESIKLGDSAHDLTELTEAVKGMYAELKPNDKDRLPNTPESRIKFMLPHEAVGIDVPFTVAERTADVERYGAPETYAVFLATAKMFQLRLAEYPQFAGSMLRMRDGDAPAHKTHNNGLSLDISSAMGWGIEQYADGPFGDYEFSPNFNQSFTERIYQDMGRMTIRGQRAIKTVLSSGDTMVPNVNNILGFEFLQDTDDYHKDHAHIVMNPSFAQEVWRPRASNLPYQGSIEEKVTKDLNIGSMAVPISQAEHKSQHTDFEAWIARPIKPAHAENQFGLPSRTEQILNQQLPRIHALQNVYREIEKQTGVPWQIMAAIHYREAGNDPNKSMLAGEQIGSVNPDHDVVVGETLLQNGIQAANLLKELAKNVYGVEIRAKMNVDEIVKATVAYNRGNLYKRAGVDPKLSPYASNGLPGSETMRFPSNGEPKSTAGKTNLSIGTLPLLVGLGYIDVKEVQ